MIDCKLIARQASLFEGFNEDPGDPDLDKAREAADAILDKAGGEWLGASGDTTTWRVAEEQLGFICQELATFNSVVMKGSSIVLTPEFYS